MSDSLAKQISRLSLEQQQEWLDSLEDDLRIELAKNPWWFIGRPEQQMPIGNWSIWLMQTGRGWGKSRTGAENLAQLVLDSPTTADGAPTEWAIIAETFSDCRKICVEGPSGFRRVLIGRGLEEGVHFDYNRSNWQITLKTGQIVHMLGADSSDVGRGLNLSGLWADEVAMWRYAYDTWTEGLSFALRIGKHPKAIVTTTPKPGHRLLRAWNKSDNGSIVLTRGSIEDNKDNLSRDQIQAFKDAYEGTRLWKQEGLGEFLEDVPGALWSYEDILVATPPEMKRIIIAIDPAVTDTETSDETGIIVVGKGVDDTLWVLGDFSCKDSTFGWAKRVKNLYDEFQADLIVYEKNQGGDVQKEILHSLDPYLPVEAIQAKLGKKLRAGPIAMLYQQHKVFHSQHFEKLEDQYLTWDPESGESPDRLDAAVHGLLKIANISAGSRFLMDLADICPNCQSPNIKGSSICASCHQAMN